YGTFRVPRAVRHSSCRTADAGTHQTTTSVLAVPDQQCSVKNAALRPGHVHRTDIPAAASAYSAGCRAALRLPSAAGLGAPTRRRRSERDKMPPMAIIT